MLVRQVQRGSVAAERPPLLVLLHGLGSNEEDLVSMAPELDSRLTVCGLRAPHAYGLGGYAWFDVTWHPDGTRTQNLPQAAASLQLLLDEIPKLPDELGCDPNRMILGGFSQGSMMSLGFALTRPSALRGLLLMSGAVVPPFVPATAPDGLAELPILVQHGTMDPVLPITSGRQVRDVLVTLGAKPEYREYPMAHQVNYESLRDVAAWLRTVLDRA